MTRKKVLRQGRGEKGQPGGKKETLTSLSGGKGITDIVGEKKGKKRPLQSKRGKGVLMAEEGKGKKLKNSDLTLKKEEQTPNQERKRRKETSRLHSLEKKRKKRQSLAKGSPLRKKSVPLVIRKKKRSQGRGDLAGGSSLPEQ